MNFKRILYTPLGKILISILLGLGLATLFRQVCTDDKCITYHGVVLNEIDEKTFKHNNKCYKYSYSTVTCDASKQIVDISKPMEFDDELTKPIVGTGLFGL